MFTQDEVKVIEGNGQIPIFDIMNVKGYCISYNGKILTFVFASDIAREGGLIYERLHYERPIQGDATKLMYDTSVVHSKQGYYKQDEIKWSRFNKYLNDTIEIAKQKNPEILAWLQLPIHPHSYIPLEFAIMILMHCRSEQALNFQWTLTSIIVPQLQSNYFQYQQEQLQQYQQQVQYYQDMIDTDQLYSTTEIASEFAMSAQRLRQLLQDKFQIIHPCNNTWQIVNHLKPYDYVRTKYNTNVPDHPYWTNAGREFVINLLTKYKYQLHRKNPKLIVPLVFDTDINR